MPLRRLFRSPRTRRALAASAVILSLGGLVLLQAPAGADITQGIAGDYVNSAAFSGPGLSGRLSLSHGMVLGRDGQRVFAELRLRADDSGPIAKVRAPLSLAIVLDTSGSMDGEKLREAKRSVRKLVQGMHDDDEVALVRYDSTANVIQPLARVGSVRHQLLANLELVDANGGTNIPWALRSGLDVLKSAQPGRVKRLVLVSDGLDDTRSEAESIASGGGERGVTLSALGVGLDFDEAYMAAVARAGHGNFAFVDKPAALASFLQRELKETAGTRIRGAHASLELPPGMRFVRAIGAAARTTESGVDLQLGSLFAGDERRVVVELVADAAVGDELQLASRISWSGLSEELHVERPTALRLGVASDAAAVTAARDGRVFASCLSAVASLRQLEATAAYRRGDVDEAKRIIGGNIRDLKEAQSAAPNDMADGLERQAEGYGTTKGVFGTQAPGSAAGRAAAKRVWADEDANLARPAY